MDHQDNFASRVRQEPANITASCHVHGAETEVRDGIGDGVTVDVARKFALFFDSRDDLRRFRDALSAYLGDVAADLRRGQPTMQNFADNLAAMTRPGETVVVMPDVGPLTSTDGLEPGDVLRIRDGSLVRFIEVISADEVNYPGELRVAFMDGSPGINTARTFAFVGRPDADGWMPWAGGENPVPGAVVEYRMGGEDTGNPREPADRLYWRHDNGTVPRARITSFRLISESAS